MAGNSPLQQTGLTALGRAFPFKLHSLKSGHPSIQDFLYRTFLGNVLPSVWHQTHGDQGAVVVPKIIRMPKPTAEGKSAAVAPAGDPEHIVRYPRLQRGSHFADFMRDKRMVPEVYHCVIQRVGSNDIFSWTQHSSLEAAMKNAEIAITLILGSSAAEA